VIAPAPGVDETKDEKKELNMAKSTVENSGPVMDSHWENIKAGSMGWMIV
jgi:hypothetical protein